MVTKQYAVLYWSNDQWNDVGCLFDSRSDANAKKAELLEQGKYALVYDARLLNAIGWPEGPPRTK